MRLHLTQTPGIALAAFVIGSSDLLAARVKAIKIGLIVFAGHVTEEATAFSLPDVARAGAGERAAVKANVLRQARRFDIHHGFGRAAGKA